MSAPQRPSRQPSSSHSTGTVPPAGGALRPVAAAAAVLYVGLGSLQAGAQTSAAPQPVQAAASAAQGSAEAEPRLRLDRELSPLPRGLLGRELPAFVRAQRVQGSLDSELTAEGQVEFRRAGTALQADKLQFDQRDKTLRATGQVRISRDGAVYSGPELQVQLDSWQGWFLQPRFDFLRAGAGGRAEKVDFLGEGRIRAWRARYTSCPREDGQSPAWQLTTERVDLNFEANEGIAESAVLRFLGVPILAAPTLSFPITDERKSGWLPPSVNLDNRSGVDISVPYYWNIAPNRDATITPRILTRRGAAVDAEFRYLQPSFEGSLGLDLLPHDRQTGTSRHAWRARHQGQLGSSAGWLAGAQLQWQAQRVSDDDWWKDFPRASGAITPRLLNQSAALERELRWGNATGSWYARLEHWQALQSLDTPISSPYQRRPQLGLRLQSSLPHGVESYLESEINRFTIDQPTAADALRPVGSRWHAVGSLARPWRGQGWWVVPSVALNTAVYDTVGRASQSRSLLTLSLDAGATFERQTVFLGRSLRQVLEPRMHYVRTPFRDQSGIPNYDSAGKDFNFTSIYSDNAWSGVDRISDSHQLTLGATTRLLRDSDGAEVLRLGLVQRVLLDPERVTPDDANPSQDAATPSLRKLSDVLLVGSTQIVQRWTLESSLRFNADTQRAVRSVLSARYNAGDFRALSAAYRFTRGQSEQVDFGWQWPLTGVVGSANAASSAAAPVRTGACNGRLYSVGRVNYSMLDSRITDSLLGLEYDAGCWIGRLVAERVSTGRSEATTRLMFQLELVGLSRLGSNPLRVLKDNIPGYRLLREDRSERTFTSTSYD